MKNKTHQSDDFSERLQAGLKLSFRRLVESKRKVNGSLVFSENGKIVKVKAKDIKL